MKASAFAYARATSVDNALELLALHGERSRVLAGGQSLIPAMNLRLVSPELIVDIGKLAELRAIARVAQMFCCAFRSASSNASTIICCESTR